MERQEQEDKEWKRQHPDGKTMTRADFDKLNPQEKMDLVSSGLRIAG